MRKTCGSGSSPAKVPPSHTCQRVCPALPGKDKAAPKRSRPKLRRPSAGPYHGVCVCVCVCSVWHASIYTERDIKCTCLFTCAYGNHCSSTFRQTRPAPRWKQLKTNKTFAFHLPIPSPGHWIQYSTRRWKFQWQPTLLSWRHLLVQGANSFYSPFKASSCMLLKVAIMKYIYIYVYI